MDFVRNSYGIGGARHAVPGIDDFHVSYDRKGLRLLYGNYGEPSAERLIPWTAVAKRIDELMDEGQLFIGKSDWSGCRDMNGNRWQEIFCIFTAVYRRK